MAKFRRRPITTEVDAEQFFKDQKPWPFGVDWEPEFRDQDGSRLGGFFKLRTGRGFQFISNKDWVVRRNGIAEVMAREIFEANYEKVED